MPVPVIEDKEWKRMNAIARFAVASEAVDIESMSFGDKIHLLIDTEPVEQYNDMDFEQYNYSHSYWDTPKTVKVRVDPNATHRPQVDAETIERLDQWVNQQTRAYARGLSHNDKVALLLEKSERYFNALDCHVKVGTTITTKDE